MESQGTVDIYSQSVRQNKLRYVTVISDGDCKNHARVKELKPYGDDVYIVKEDCVGHVQNRMGCRLRDLKNAYKGKKLDDRISGQRGGGGEEMV